jgi:hypothetical protein
LKGSPVWDHSVTFVSEITIGTGIGIYYTAYRAERSRRLNFRRVLHVVCFLIGNSLASEFYMPTFRNTVPSTQTSRCIIIIIIHLHAYEDRTECPETSAYKIQRPGNYPEENMQQTPEVYPNNKSKYQFFQRTTSILDKDSLWRGTSE